jgi:hypothetical protein
MLPTSARFLFYELVMKNIISKSGDRPDQIVINALTSLRESGEIPWEWIADETRSLENFTGYSSIRSGLLAYLDMIELDPWLGDYPLVLCESRSLGGVLRTLAREYRTLIAATNGQVGGFLHTVIGPALKEQYEATDCIPRVGYLGDLDKAGGDIEGNTRDVLEKIVGCELAWERLAILPVHVNNPFQQLPVISKFDKRDQKFHDSVETEALGQDKIIAIVRFWLNKILPDPLSETLEKEQAEREALRDYLSAYTSP